MAPMNNVNHDIPGTPNRPGGSCSFWERHLMQEALGSPQAGHEGSLFLGITPPDSMKH